MEYWPWLHLHTDGKVRFIEGITCLVSDTGNCCSRAADVCQAGCK
jgi:hypothetical protein